MADRSIFLSHIQEESALAILIKNALESEFSGFVDVFVSSDGTSIPKGANFLKRIEDSLINCIGAIYLISPASVKRNWINFEIGAVWLRSAMSVKSGNAEIPALPLCHSGALPSTLPAPLNNLNAAVANSSSELENTFKSLQTAVGGRGSLKTDFDQLAADIQSFERSYTMSKHLASLLSLLGVAKNDAVNNANSLGRGKTFNTSIVNLFAERVKAAQSLEADQLSGVINVDVTSHTSTLVAGRGLVNSNDVEVKISTDALIDCSQDLLKTSA